MEYRPLGRTGLRVSPLCLGTMNFGPRTSEADSFAIMDAALAAGVNFFDTANVYGGGETETIVGRWFAQGGERREKVVLATKVFGGARRLAQHVAAVGPAHPRRLRGEPASSADGSHRPLPDAPRGPEHAVGRDLAGDGPPRRAGQGHLRGQLQLRRLAHRRGGGVGEAARLGRAGLRAEPLQPDGADRRARGPAGLPGLRRRRAPLEPPRRGPVGRRAAQRDRGAARPTSASRRGSKRTPTSSQGYEKLCAELGHEPAQVALAWLLTNPVVTAPIVGPRTEEQFTRCLAALDVTLDRDMLAALDVLFPGPGGAAPEAYAW